MRSDLQILRHVLVAALVFSGLIGTAQAQASTDKLATDLRLAVSGQPIKTNWVKDSGVIRYVKVLIVTDGSDPDMVTLRAQVIAAGGSVYYRYQSVAALSVMLPASQVSKIAARVDVQSLSPNRLTARTASTLELTTGTSSVRALSGTGYTKLDGTGVGIAVLDSGIAWSHKNFTGVDGKTSRVARAVDMLKIGDSSALKTKDWKAGVDVSDSIYPGIGNSKTASKFDKDIAADGGSLNDAYGHGTHVASAAAARGNYQLTDSTGVAPNASLYDVRVLDGNGYGQLSDVLAGIDWVIFHAKELNIRVMNLSLASSSTESYLTDPFCRAVRSAVASGITVVVAAGNYGKDSATGAENFGTIGAPGNEPSVITVGAVNMRGTTQRGDDTVNLFSSRGPTRGGVVTAGGMRLPDNLIKPDLVAPGNKIIGALAADKSGGTSSWASLPKLNATLSLAYGGVLQPKNQALMELSGTSIAAPVVSGTAALMLQANPGLTPPLIKALMQYSAQPLAGANILQQGAGLLNVDGSIQLARALRTDLSKAIAAGTIKPGDSMVAAAKVLPTPITTVSGVPFSWGRMIVVSVPRTTPLRGETPSAEFGAIRPPRRRRKRRRRHGQAGASCGAAIAPDRAA